MSTYEELLEVFKDVYDGEVDISKATMDADLKEDLDMNSIGMLYMAVAIEEQFGVKLTNDDFATIRTVEDVVRIVDERK